jgi:hypothetical protein
MEVFEEDVLVRVHFIGNKTHSSICQITGSLYPTLFATTHQISLDYKSDSGRQKSVCKRISHVWNVLNSGQYRNIYLRRSMYNLNK